VPDEPAKELAQQRAHAASGGCLLCDYLAVELDDGHRVVTGNEHFTALVPFWAVWPFETLVLPRTHVSTLARRLTWTARGRLAHQPVPWSPRQDGGQGQARSRPRGTRSR
jgi:UDPglucose--hexose-1-phosphate uridylyltransferase